MSRFFGEIRQNGNVVRNIEGAMRRIVEGAIEDNEGAEE